MFSNVNKGMDAMLNFNLPKILVDLKALKKMKIYVDNCSSEIGWQGFATFDKSKNEIYIEDVWLLEQVANGATCELLPQAQANAFNALLQNPETAEKIGDIRMWGHSHINMDVCPSSQDVSQLCDFIRKNQCEFFVGVICNKRGDMSCFFANEHVYVKYVPWEIYFPNTINEDDVIAEVNAKVKPFQNPNQSSMNAGLIADKYNQMKYLDSSVSRRDKKKQKKDPMAELMESISAIEDMEDLSDFDSLELIEYMKAHKKADDIETLRAVLEKSDECIMDQFGYVIFPDIEGRFLAKMLQYVANEEASQERLDIILEIYDCQVETYGIDEYYNGVDCEEETYDKNLESKEDTYLESIKDILDKLLLDDDFLAYLNYLACLIIRYYNGGKK